MTISISGQVPAEAQNGMVALEDEWTHERTPDAVYAVVKIERDGIKFKDDKQEWSATMKLAHIEPLIGDLALQGKSLLEAACGARGGDVSTELDFPTDDDEADGEDDEDEAAEEDLVAPEPDLEAPRHLEAVDL